MGGVPLGMVDVNWLALSGSAVLTVMPLSLRLDIAGVATPPLTLNASKLFVAVRPPKLTALAGALGEPATQ
jgi:hypothetical protein